MKASQLALLLLSCLPISVLAQTRTWMDQKGRTLQGEMVRVIDDAVELRIEGKLVKVKLNLLSEADQEFVRQAAATEATESEEEGDPPADKPAEIKPVRRDWLVAGKKVQVSSCAMKAAS